MFHTTRKICTQLLTLAILCCCCGTEDYSEQENNYYKFKEIPYMAKALVSRVDLGRDKKGCLCVEYDEVLTVCIGRDSCDRLPIELNITSMEMGIRKTNVKNVRVGDLDNIHHVRKLRIEGNFHLSSISPGVFEKFDKLSNLSISSNPLLTTLHKNTFVGLKNLKILSLIKNGFTDINHITQAVSTGTVPKLIELPANENTFSIISEDNFSPLNDSQLQKLNLTLCQIEYIHPDSLVHLKKLKVLLLGDNLINFTTLTQFLKGSITVRLPLRVLDLNGAGFRKTVPKQVMEVIAESKITDLSLAGNQFDIILSEEFPWMPNVRMLDMSGARVSHIHDNAFANLPNLRTLILGDNKLTSSPKGELLFSLETLDLQENSGKNGLFPFDISNGAFSKMGKLRYLNLNCDAINDLFRESFLGLENLEILHMNNCSISNIQNGTFKHLTKLCFLDLENNLFIRSNYPVGVNPDVFNGLGNLKVLLLAGNGIKYFSLLGNPFVHLNSLKYLGLERNNMISLSLEQFSPLKQLQKLNIAYNRIRYWDQVVFSTNRQLITLIMDYNKVSRITTAMLNDFYNLTELTLSFNSIICDCAAHEDIRDELEGKRGEYLLNIIEKSEASCINWPPNSSILMVADYFRAVQNKTAHCDAESVLRKVLPLGFSLAVLILVIVLVCYHGDHLKYWVFLVTLHLSVKSKKTTIVSETSTFYK
ncbi:toll-like receptor 8 isoform X2 [Leptinotarsa decemlineata]|uniref:toll-like receptor 8 isoform X2 n=1 Tax=Leptinotarsa decemlineata TaxID=7539 RepID=UPI003D304BFD